MVERIGKVCVCVCVWNRALLGVLEDIHRSSNAIGEKVKHYEVDDCVIVHRREHRLCIRFFLKTKTQEYQDTTLFSKIYSNFSKAGRILRNPTYTCIYPHFLNPLEN